jgi:hypothetical protein
MNIGDAVKNACSQNTGQIGSTPAKALDDSSAFFSERLHLDDGYCPFPHHDPVFSSPVSIGQRVGHFVGQ